MVRWLFRLAVVGGAALVVAIVLHQGSSYRVRVLMTNANGLRLGSQVKVGGVPVGSVASLGLGSGDQVVAGLKLNRGYHITSEGRVAVVPVDLLGSMYVQLTPGHGVSEPSGATIAASRVTYPVELDQVMNVLDASTRARLGILINEAGTALTGRGVDFNTVLGMLPHSLSDGNELLGQLVSDNHTLADLIQHSNSFVSQLIPQQRQLTAVIHTAGQTMSVTAAHQTDLQAILNRAPQTLITAQHFLADLRTTAVPLKPAAQAITDAAPELTATLAAIPGFQRAADPTLDTAVRATPDLTELADRVNPVVVAARPTVSELADFASTSSPVTYAARESIDNALGLVEGWGKAIQNGDGIGHVFHGIALVSPDLLTSLSGSLNSSSSTAASRRHAAKPAGTLLGASAGVKTKPKTSLGSTLKNTVATVGSKVGGVVTTLTQTLGAVSQGVSGAANKLGLGSSPGSSSTGTTTTSSSSLSNLLGYLMKS